MSVAGQCLPPSSSLPRLRSLFSVTELELRTALQHLQSIYCPLRLPAYITKSKNAVNANADSGYASEDDIAERHQRDNGEALTILRLDEFERGFTVRWLTSLISRAEELPFEDENISSIIDEASFILSSFSDTGSEEDDAALIRDFSFPVSLSLIPGGSIDVQLNDAPLSGTDHTDVGLQSWGASIVFSGLLCASPERLCLSHLPSNATLIELGAGTGLISLTLAKLLPRLSATNAVIVATDYHPAVLDNLRANIATSFPTATSDSMPVKVAALDWSAPPESLQSSVHMLFAADVVYAPEHAVWLRDCAAQVLAPNGIFWLVVTVRRSGKFEGIPDTAEAAFQDGKCPRRADGRVLKILAKEMLDKKRGIGRGDESGYMLFKIGWASV